MKEIGGMFWSLTAILFTLINCNIVLAQNMPGPRHEKVLVYMADFVDSDEADRLYTMEDIKQSFQIDGYSFSDYIFRVSRGQLVLEIDFLDSMILTHPQTALSDYDSVGLDAQTLNQLLDLSEYDYLMRYWLTGNYKCNSTLGDTSIDLGNGEPTLKLAFSQYYGTCLKSLAHEMGHSLGAGHTFEIICEPYGMPSNLLDPLNATDSCGQYTSVYEQDHPGEYPFDIALLDDARATFSLEGIMGATPAINPVDFQKNHYLGAWQRDFGWLETIAMTEPSRLSTTLTSLESFRGTNAPRLLSINTGKSLYGISQIFNFEYSEQSPCQLLVTMEGPVLQSYNLSPLTDTLFVLRRHKPTLDRRLFHPYNHNMTISAATPFIDPYRGIAASVKECDSDSSDTIKVDVERTALRVEPAVFVHFEENSQLVEITNDNEQSIMFESAYIGGRHPWAFTIRHDTCSNRQLNPGESCVIEMNYRPSGERDVATLFMPNSDPLRNKAAVALYGADAPINSYSNTDLRLAKTATFFPGIFSLPETSDLLRMTLKIEGNDSEYFDVFFKLDNSVTGKIQFDFVGLYLLEYGYGRAYSPFQETYLDDTYKKRMKDVENIGTYYPSQNIAILPRVSFRNSSEILNNVRLHVDPVSLEVTVLD